MNYDVVILVCSTMLSLADCNPAHARYVIPLERNLDEAACRQAGAVEAQQWARWVPDGFYAAAFCQPVAQRT